MTLVIDGHAYTFRQSLGLRMQAGPAVGDLDLYLADDGRPVPLIRAVGGVYTNEALASTPEGDTACWESTYTDDGGAELRIALARDPIYYTATPE